MPLGGSEFREKLIYDDKNRFFEIDKKKVRNAEKNFSCKKKYNFYDFVADKNWQNTILKFFQETVQGSIFKVLQSPCFGS